MSDRDEDDETEDGAPEGGDAWRDQPAPDRRRTPASGDAVASAHETWARILDSLRPERERQDQRIWAEIERQLGVRL